ncbi:hypothetical protein HDV57DRAFT_336306 [Trichoderma longibrachiatum]|uniref:Uncharacterized protein n=1 Tax=Trichoderma longibrachiatum ATCC 18648 TaxID=983965 RepID=A0A2T4BYK7_TRILO|nr:hypothetical protein M440DRAFT_115846 [Trichoderma longibrachiatum ATCC 18648]
MKREGKRGIQLNDTCGPAANCFGGNDKRGEVADGLPRVEGDFKVSGTFLSAAICRQAQGREALCSYTRLRCSSKVSRTSSSTVQKAPMAAHPPGRNDHVRVRCRFDLQGPVFIFLAIGRDQIHYQGDDVNFPDLRNAPRSSTKPAMGIAMNKSFPSLERWALTNLRL